MNRFIIPALPRLLVAVLTSLAAFHVAPLLSAEPPISVEEVAKILGYPADKLSVQDITGEANRHAERKGRTRPISAHAFSGVENTFAPLSIGVAAEGSLLTDEHKKYVEGVIARQRERNDTNLLVKWLSFDDVGYGISGLVVLGPGGSDTRCIMTLFNKMDVQVTINIPGETRLEVLPEAKAYNRLIYEGDIGGKLIECLSTIASKVAGRPIEATVSDKPPTAIQSRQSTPRDLQPSSRNERPSIEAPYEPQPALPKASAVDPAANEQKQRASTRKTLWWSIGGLFFVGLVLLRVIHGRRLSKGARGDRASEKKL